MHRRTSSLILALCLMTGLSGIFLAAAQADEDIVLELPRLDGYTIYFTEDNGEASRFDRSGDGISRLAGLLWQLGARTETLEWRNGIPADADLIIMAGPDGNLTPDITARLWAYLGNNGRLLMLADPVVGRGNQQRGLSDGAPLQNLMWSEMGIRFGSGAVVRENPAGAPLLIEDLTTGSFTAHPTTAGLDGDMAFFRARPVDGDASLQRFQNVPLVFAPADYYGESAFVEYIETGAAQFDIGQDTPRGRLPLAVASRSMTSDTRVVLVGDKSFATNDGGLQTSPPRSASFLYPDNPRFLLAAIAWLLDIDPDAEGVEIVFPTPAATSTPTFTPTPLALVADLELDITVNTDDPGENEAVIFTLTVTNTGPDVARGAFLTATLPQNAVYVSSTVTTRRVFNERFGTWDIEDLPAGATAELSIVLLMPPGSVGAVVSLSASVEADAAVDDPNPDNNTASQSVTVAAVESD